jgi:hypothetical protein
MTIRHVGDIDAPGAHELLLPNEPSSGSARGATGAGDAASCLNIEYYQRFFDVDTEQVCVCVGGGGGGHLIGMIAMCMRARLLAGGRVGDQENLMLPSLPHVCTCSEDSNEFAATDDMTSSVSSTAHQRPLSLPPNQQVQYRLKASVWPYKNGFLKTIKGKGDLYGRHPPHRIPIFVILCPTTPTASVDLACHQSLHSACVLFPLEYCGVPHAHYFSRA